MYRKISSLLALLLIGSVSLIAQDGGDSQSPADPFGEVNDSKYQNTINITGYVCMATLANGQWSAINDEVLGKSTVVAVYCGDELRGKGSPADYNDKYFNLLMMTVYGENKDQLHFKVFTDGRVIEVDQDITFKNDIRLGKAQEPYYIYLPSPVTTTFSTEGWASLCLPFDARVPDGVTLWDATGIENGELVMKEVKSSVLPKDTPVVLQGEGGTTCEWLSAVIDAETLSGAANDESSILKGTTEPTDVTANSVLTLGHSKKTGDIGFWLFTGTTLPANRAYIADFPSGINGARILTDNDGGTMNIRDLRIDDVQSVYSLSGRKIVNGNSPSGIYVMEGKKVLIK